MEWALIGAGILGVVGLVLLATYILSRSIKSALLNAPQPDPIQLPPTQQVVVDLKPMQDSISNLPNKLLQSIQSSINTKKGALGELIGYIELEAQYDRIIPLGNVVDFMCIKFPTQEEPGHVDFVDIKTGKSSRLSKDQRMLQQLIKDKKINFVKLTVNTQTSNETESETNQTGLSVL